MKNGVLYIFVLLNATALFCAINPWITDWQNIGFLVLVLEAALVLLVGVPVLFYQTIVKKKTFKQSLTDSVDKIMAFVSYFI